VAGVGRLMVRILINGENFNQWWEDHTWSGGISKCCEENTEEVSGM
jgi:hypothetical protein